MGSMSIGVATISASIGILYVLVIVMIWVISAISLPTGENDTDFQRFENSGKGLGRGIDLSGNNYDFEFS